MQDSARFDKQNEDDQVLGEIEIFINLNLNQNSTESVIDKIDGRSQAEQLIQNQETNISGWTFDKIISMTIYFYKTTKLGGSSYEKGPLGYSAI